MTRLIGGILALGIVAVSAGVCLGHGAHCEPVEGSSAVQVHYDDGSPMAFCDVEVIRPGDDTEVFQTGITDCHGRFAFVPDTTGTWKIAVDDGMGHLAVARLTPGTVEVPGESAKRGDRIREIVTGVAVIFGLFGIVALFYCRRKVR